MGVSGSNAGQNRKALLGTGEGDSGQLDRGPEVVRSIQDDLTWFLSCLQFPKAHTSPPKREGTSRGHQALPTQMPFTISGPAASSGFFWNQQKCVPVASSPGTPTGGGKGEARDEIPRSAPSSSGPRATILSLKKVAFPKPHLMVIYWAEPAAGHTGRGRWLGPHFEAGTGLYVKGRCVRQGQRAAGAGLKPCLWKPSLCRAHSQQSPSLCLTPGELSGL